jgi:hypothetical protein
MSKKKTKKKAAEQPKLGPKKEAEKQTSEQRHARDCKICNHQEREAIEAEFVGWTDVTQLAKDYGLSRNSVYRHAEMMGLREKRRQNIRAALERIIEKAGSVQVTAAAVVSAVQALAKINAKGEWVERVEHVDLHAVFDRMSREELDTYARDGKLPAWVGEFLSGATRIRANMEAIDG